MHCAMHYVMHRPPGAAHYAGRDVLRAAARPGAPQPRNAPSWERHSPRPWASLVVGAAGSRLRHALGSSAGRSRRAAHGPDGEGCRAAVRPGRRWPKVAEGGRRWLSSRPSLPQARRAQARQRPDMEPRGRERAHSQAVRAARGEPRPRLQPRVTRRLRPHASPGCDHTPSHAATTRKPRLRPHALPRGAAAQPSHAAAHVPASRRSSRTT